jgi:hypothetical protein
MIKPGSFAVKANRLSYCLIIGILGIIEVGLGRSQTTVPYQPDMHQSKQRLISLKALNCCIAMLLLVSLVNSRLANLLSDSKHILNPESSS